MGVLTLIKTLTADSDTTLSFVNGAASVVFDSTYDEYLFVVSNINPETDGAAFQFNVSDDTSSHSYDIAKQTTYSSAYHREDDGDTGHSYAASLDLANDAGVQKLNSNIGSGSDENSSGTLQIYQPASTTYVKHFYSRFVGGDSGNLQTDNWVAGYINSTAAITAVQFSMSSGDFEGVIQLFGIS
jgi:hypothetical protein